MKSSKFKIQSLLHLTSNVSRLALFTACCLLLTSCASQKASKPTVNGYLSVLEKWTRKGKVYDNFETKLLINATYKNEEFLVSYVEEYSKVYMLDSERAKKLVKDESEVTKNYHEFFIAVHTPVVEWSDLERKPPIWSVYLVNDQDERVVPLEIKRVKDRVPGDNRFYPYFDDWSKGFTVKFPLTLPDGKALITDKTKYIKFIITGSPGKGELIWNLAP